jgi:hypothetical protein
VPSPAELMAALAEERAKRTAAEQRLEASESHGRELKRTAEDALAAAAENVKRLIQANESERGPQGLPVDHLISGSAARAGGVAAAMLRPLGSSQAMPHSHPFAGERPLSFTPMATPARALPENRVTSHQLGLAMISLADQGNLMNALAGAGPQAGNLGGGGADGAERDRSQGSSGPAMLQQTRHTMQLAQQMAKEHLPPYPPCPTPAEADDWFQIARLVLKMCVCMRMCVRMCVKRGGDEATLIDFIVGYLPVGVRNAVRALSARGVHALDWEDFEQGGRMQLGIPRDAARQQAASNLGSMCSRD